MVKIKRLIHKRGGEKLPGGDSFQDLVVLSKKYADEKEFAREEKCYRRMLQLRPNNSDVLNHLGTVLCKRGEYSESIDCLRKALKSKPDDYATYLNLANTLSNIGLVEEAIHSLRTFLSSSVTHYHQSDRDEQWFKLHAMLLFDMNYLAGVEQAVIHAEAEKFWRELQPPAARIYTHAGPHSERHSGKIRLGFVSGDFRVHSVAYFLLPLLEKLDRKLFDVYCYSNVSKPDELTPYFQQLASAWRPIFFLSTDETADLIYRDQIDILIDLAGFSDKNSLTVFARKPAPVQVSWLGYPNTTGLKAIDYRLTDAICDPPGEADRYHTETLIRLAHGFLCYSLGDTLPESIKETPSTGVVFGSFNNINKLTDEVFATWAEILRQSPHSSIYLKHKAFSDKVTRKRIVALFGANGVSPHRVHLEPRTPAVLDHLAVYNKIDIGLDPFPYNGTTTTFEALSMNVPVITLRGDRHASRVGTSILTNLGLSELIAESKEEYIALAVRLAADKETTLARYKELRRTLGGSVLCDAQHFARRMEGVFLEMVKKTGDRSPAWPEMPPL